MSVNAAAGTLPAIAAPPTQTQQSEEEIAEAVRVMRDAPSMGIGPMGGPETDRFEAALTEFVGCADTVAVCNGSAALEMSAMLSGLQAGDEVILPAHTFVSTAVPFGRTGATLVWADIEPDTRVISAASIRALLSERTRVIVVVHLLGMPADMEAIMAISEERGLIVVEDCAQAPGARYKGRRVGSFGEFGCFSFHTAKNITTMGEGGALTVRRLELSEQARRMRFMGNWPFEQEREKDWIPAGGNLVEPVPGRWPVNFCMSEVNAAVGCAALKRLDSINARRREQASRFVGALQDYQELVFPTVPEECEHAYHLMIARYDGDLHATCRDDLMALMRDKYNVKCIVQYWPLYRSELFVKLGFGEADVPETDRYYDNMISFPWWSDMADEVLDDMAARTRMALDELRGRA